MGRYSTVEIWKVSCQFRSVNCLSIRRPLKQLSKVSPASLSRIFLINALLSIIIIKASVAEDICSKIPCFQYILLNTFTRMRLKYDNYCLRRMLFQTFKHHSHCKSLIAKTFDDIAIDMKSVSPI